MNQINDPPLDYPFGLDFNYALWTTGTTLNLVNVRWNNDYRDAVKFDTQAALNAYLDSIENAGVTIDNLSHAKPNQPIRINLPLNSAYRFNYLRASNPLQPIAGDIVKYYYYFITDVRYLAPNTTEIVVQLDVFQTFIYDIEFGNCYIERGHIGIANENNFDNYGRDYLTIPEGFDTGHEYQTVSKRTEIIMQADGETGVGSTNSSVLVASTVDLLADPGDVNAPILVAASGSFFNLLPSGASYYVWKGASNFFAYMSSISDTPWVGQGIISITLIPDIGRYTSTELDDEETEPTAAPWSRLQMLKHSLFTDWRNDVDEILANIPSRYRHLRKFFTFPYMVIELTTFTGTPIIIKPESWADPDASIIERASLTPPNQRVIFNPYKYNAIPGSTTDSAHPYPATFSEGGDDYGEFIDFATMITNFPTFALVNNGAIAFMAANMNGIAFQQQSAGWSQQRALGSNQLGYDQATAGMNLANELTGIGINSDALQTTLGNTNIAQQGAVSAATSLLGSGARGAMAGGPAGAAAAVGGAGIGALGAGIGTALQQQTNNQAFGIRASQANQQNRAQVGNQGFIRDTNKNLADWAARGDYANSLAAINAKVQDANLIQPSTSGQVGGETMNIINNIFGVSARWKMLDQSSMRIIGDYWLRYGYAIRQFATMPVSLKVMTKFTYWKLSETYIITSAMPESIKQAIRGIFEKGVTIWSNPSDIGNIDIADNVPLEGITL